MLFMVIERFADNDMALIYQRVRDSGRMLPDGLNISTAGSNRISAASSSRSATTFACSPMGAATARLGRAFEIIPVVPSKDTCEVVAPYLDQPDFACARA